MKRAIFLYSLLFICLSAGAVASGQSEAKPGAAPEAVKACPFNISGLWRSDATTQSTPTFFNFSPEGHVLLMTHSGDVSQPQDFEIITSVNYKLDKPTAPKRIEFTAWRGDDVFQQGVTSWKVTEFGDDSFTTLDPITERQTRWTREKTHRYFLTVAARSSQLPHGGPAFVMWTVMDGRYNRIDALGVHLVRDENDKTTPVFGLVPAETYEQITEENDKEKKKDKDENVIARFELTEDQFRKTRKVYEAWEKHVNDKKLPHADPHQNAMELLSSAIESIDPCGEKFKLNKPTRPERDEITAKIKLPQQSLEYVRVMRKKNGELHISDLAFPWQWKPAIQLPGQ